MAKSSGTESTLLTKTPGDKFAAERQKLAERLAELDRLEAAENERLREASARNLAEAFTRHGVVVPAKRDAARLAKIIATLGVDEVLSRLGG